MKEKDQKRVWIREHIGRLIMQAREDRGWTRYELSKRSQVAESHLRKIEEGAYSIRVDIFDQICRALDIEVKVPFDK